jgi:hypothetical protein
MPPKILPDFIQNVGNEYKGTWTPIQPKRNTKSTSQSNDLSWSSTHLTLASCTIALGELCVFSEEGKSNKISVLKV